MSESWPTNGALVEIEWVDSATIPGWHLEDPTDGDDGLVSCRTAGYLLSKGRRSVKVAQSQTSHGAIGEIMSIPRTCVRVIRNLSRCEPT